MKIIKDKNVILAKHILKSNKKEGLSFYSDDNDFIQVGKWLYQKNTELKKHYHKKFDRTVSRTYEVLYVINGKIEAEIYNLEKTLIDTLIVNKGDILILMESGHGYKILEDNTEVLEIKNGPYYGADLDRERF